MKFWRGSNSIKLYHKEAPVAGTLWLETTISEPVPATTEASVQRRQAAAMTRKLALLRGNGLIVKVQKTNRSRLSAEGQGIMTVLVAAYEADVNRLNDAA